VNEVKSIKTKIVEQNPTVKLNEGLVTLFPYLMLHDAVKHTDQWCSDKCTTRDKFIFLVDSLVKSCIFHSFDFQKKISTRCKQLAFLELMCATVSKCFRLSSAIFSANQLLIVMQLIL
jgi:hypothetical protein